MVYGGGLYSFVLFITPWTREFGWSRAATAGLVSAFWFSAPFILLGARATKRFGVIRLLAVGITLEAVSVCLLPLADALWQMYVLRTIMGFGKVIFAVCVPVVLATWFRRRFSFALGIAWAGWNLGGLVLGPATSLIIDRYGWRIACVAIAGGLVVFALVPLLRVLRVHSPAQLGLARDGARQQQSVASDTGSEDFDAGNASDEEERTEGTLFRSGAFWLIAFSTVAYYAALAGMLTHQAALVESAGYSAQIASVILGSVAGLAAVSGPLFGRLLDRGHVLRTGIIMQILLFSSVLALSVVANMPSVMALVLYAVTFGLTLGGADVSWVALVRRRFPKFSVAQTYSAWYFFEVVTLALAPIAVGHIFDLTGSYGRTILILTLPAGLSFVFLLSAQISHGRSLDV
jgi:MFS family permease